jgi:hypothetical protein
MSKAVDEILAEEGAASENGEVPDALPAQVKVSRPNLGRPTVVSVPWPAAEHASLQVAAARANLPVSTLLLPVSGRSTDCVPRKKDVPARWRSVSPGSSGWCSRVLREAGWGQGVPPPRPPPRCPPSSRRLNQTVEHG